MGIRKPPARRAPLRSVQQARAYQLELLDAAIRDNVLVFLDTGSGKTLVAVLLIKASFSLRTIIAAQN